MSGLRIAGPFVAGLRYAVLAVVLTGGTAGLEGATGGDLSGEQLARDNDAKADNRNRVECFISDYDGLWWCWGG
jgi:hypothetical protein